MRILFISNYFPPAREGWGYGQLCEEVANGLSERGHDIAVLTSVAGKSLEPTHPYPVFRQLTIEPDWNKTMPAAWQFFAGRRQRESRAIHGFKRIVQEFSPDIVFVWHAIGLPRVLLKIAEESLRTVYYFADYQPEIDDEYLAYWQSEPSGLLARNFKRPLAKAAVATLIEEGKPVKLNYRYTISVSDYVRKRLVSSGSIPRDSVVIHIGVDADKYAPLSGATLKPHNEGIAFLVAGRVVADKGIHTVIKAFGLLKDEPHAVRLTILGDGPTDYAKRLREMVTHYQLDDVVSFHAAVPQQLMPEKLREHDVLLLPSEYPEPLASSMLEGMASGLLVIGTTTGGSGELLVHDETGYVFEAGNAESLSEQIRRVNANVQHARTIAAQGRAAVLANFTIDHTVSRIEAYLTQVQRMTNVLPVESKI